MRRVEVVKVFVFTECYKLSPGRLLLRNDTPISTAHPDKKRPRVHFVYIQVNVESFPLT